MGPTGVVPAISAIIKGLTAPGQGVIVTTPVYNCFFSSIRNNKCRIVESPMLLRDNRYELDFEAIEHLAADPLNTIFLLCNPHNPGGRVWTPVELRRLAEICRRNGVTVISDEIHCELTFAPAKYTPFALIAEETHTPYISCVAPSKAFNTAGLQIANIVTPDSEFRRLIDRAINDNEVCDVNPFGVVGLMAAYDEGAEWLEQLLDYLHANIELTARKFSERAPRFPFMVPEASYLGWVDCRSSGLDSNALANRILSQGKVRVSPGSDYGSAGDRFIRLNLAAPRAVICEGVDRILDVLTSL